MEISFNWLKKYINIDDLSAEEVASILGGSWVHRKRFATSPLFLRQQW